MSFNSHDSPYMVWRPRLGYYSNASKNGKLEVENGDLTKPIEATSYDWWVFFLKVRNKYIFNDGHYSSQTSSHQRGVRKILRSANIEYVTIHSNKHLGEPESVLKDLHQSLFDAEKHYEFTLSKRCKPTAWASVEERQKGALENVISWKTELFQFTQIFTFPESTIELSRKNAEEAFQRRKDLAKSIRQRGSEQRKEDEKTKKRLINESWKQPTQLQPITERSEYRIDTVGDENVTKALNVFLTTDETRQKFGNYFIDGNELVYRIAGVEYGQVKLLENVIAKKFIEDGRLVIVGNNSKLNLIGRRVAYGHVRDNWAETEIQKRISKCIPMIPFDEFKAIKRFRMHDNLVDETPLTLANITIYRLTGKVPGRK